MNNFYYIFIVCVVLLAIIIAITVALMHQGNTHDSDNIFRDDEGRHVYYDRSRIKKEEFMEKHPGVDPHEVRSIGRLFGFCRIGKKR